MNRKRSQVLAVFSAGGLFWLVQMDGWSQIESALGGVRCSIVVQSPGRLTANDYFAGERLRFVLRGVDADKVVWVFGESEVQVAGIETEFRFPLDTSRYGLTSVHRVDVFFRVGEGYQTLSTTIKINHGLPPPGGDGMAPPRYL